MPICPHFSSVSRAHSPHSFLEVFYYSNTVCVHASSPQSMITFLVCRNESFCVCVCAHILMRLHYRKTFVITYCSHSKAVRGLVLFQAFSEPSSPLLTHTTGVTGLSQGVMDTKENQRVRTRTYIKLYRKTNF